MYSIYVYLCSDCRTNFINCDSGASNGWITPTIDLGAFETSCYYFGMNSTYYWDHAYKQCVDSGGRLAVIETNAEFTWIMQIYSTFYSYISGFYVDATRNRYGNVSLTPSWRGGVALSEGIGTLFNNLSYTSLYSSSCGMLYAPAFYLTATGNLQEIREREIRGGFLCKKYSTSKTPLTVGYNNGYCFPSLHSIGSCPSGWLTYTPNLTPFCYSPLVSTISGADEQFRQCHNLGADLVYIESANEYSWLYTGGGASNAYFSNDLNAHRFRYGPAFSYSNGQSFSSIAYSGPGPTFWLSTNPSDTCGMESCIEAIGNQSYGWNDSPCVCFSQCKPFPLIIGGVCKRPLCGTIHL